jgi:hypothetical protein
MDMRPKKAFPRALLSVFATAVSAACGGGDGDGGAWDASVSDVVAADGAPGESPPLDAGVARDAGAAVTDAATETGADALEASDGDDGGSSDGSSTADQGVTPTCVTAGTELCDDFESGQLDATKWKINKSNNDTVAVETGLAHSGQYAVHMKLVAGQHNIAQITEGVTFPAMANTLYARAFVYFSPGIPAGVSGNGYHMGYIYASGDNNLGSVQAGMGSIGPKDFLGYSIYFGPPSHEFGPWSSLTVTGMQWLCVELYESGTDGVGETRKVWVNDTELMDLRSTYDGQAPPQFDMLSFGVWQYDGNTPTLADMWIDDVRVSSRKIGCGP